MTLRHYLWAALATFLLGCLTGIPAQWVLAKHASWTDGQIQLYGIRGSLWSGSADVAQVQGLRLESLEWQLSPWALLTAAARLDIRAQLERNAFKGEVTLRPGQRLTLNRVSGRIPVATVVPLVGIRWLPLTGNLQFDLDEVKLKAGQLRVVTGLCQLQDAQWTLTQPALSFGSLTAQLTTGDDGRIEAALQSGAGPLKVDGNAVLAADGAYNVDVRLRPQESASTGLRNIVQTLGQQQPDGSRHVTFKGKVPGHTP